MGLKDCEITLDNKWNTYYPGQTINGNVVFTFDSPKTVRGIYIKCKGICETRWIERESRRSPGGKAHHTSRTYYGSEEYFSISNHLVGGKSNDEIVLPAGTHEYQFSFDLPRNLPSSFEGEYGHVRYTIKATLDRPWKFDQDTKMAFTVVSHFDLNSDPAHKHPIHMQITKRFCCCCCKSAPMTLDVSIPISGFCCGQTIPIQVSCENGSNVAVGDVQVALRKIVSFHSQTPRRAVRESHIEIVKIHLGGTGPNSTQDWQKGLLIPPLPPSDLINCRLIDLEYELKVTCKPSGAHVNIDTKHLITIGTIPITAPGSTQEKVPEESMPLLPPVGSPYPGQPAGPVLQPSAPPLSNVPDTSSAEPPHYNDLFPQPKESFFSEGQFAATTIQDEGDNENVRMQGGPGFMPRYLTYGFVIPPA